MRVFDSYYQFKKDPKKRTKLILQKEYGEYELFKEFNHFYLVNTDYVQVNARRKAQYKLVANGNYGHISSLFIGSSSYWGYGNVRTANEDLLIFYLDLEKDLLEVYISEGRYYEWNLILNQIQNGELTSEIELLRKGALE